MSAKIRMIASAIVGMVICSGSATAQVSAPTTRGAPLESKLTGSVTTREAHNSQIEAAAQADRDKGVNASPRYRKFFIAWPDSVDEYQRMARYSIMLLTVVSQNRDELPLARVYIRTGGRDVTLTKLSSTRSEYPPGNVVAKMFGRYREDGFYLVPGAALMRDGAVLADFATVRKEMGVVQLPSATGQQRVKTFPTDDPPANSKPNAETLKTFINLHFPGFPVPKL